MYSSVNQAQASSSSFSWSSRTLHAITDTSQALALSSCSLLMPCGPAQRLFSVQRKHFHLMKDACRPTQLYDMNPVTPGRLTCPQVATGKCSVSPEPSNARDCSSKVHNPLLPIAWPCCGTPGPAFILLLGLTLSSMLHPCLFPLLDTSHTREPVKLEDPNGRTACPTAWASAEPPPVMEPAYRGPPSMSPRVTVVSNPTEGHQALCCLHCGKREQMQQFLFLVRGCPSIPLAAESLTLH